MTQKSEPRGWQRAIISLMVCWLAIMGLASLHIAKADKESQTETEFNKATDELLQPLFVQEDQGGQRIVFIHNAAKKVQAEVPRSIYHQLEAGEFIPSEKAFTKSQQKTVYLTFDDGPSKLTTEVLDILKQEGIQATFFVLGQLVEKHAETMRRIVEEGHALGNHSYNHNYQELYPDFTQYWTQLKQTEEIIEQSVGIRPQLVRAPGGTYKKFDAFYFYYLDRAGYIVHDWNVDSGDSRRKGVPQHEIVANVTQAPLRDELIVLLHDGAHHHESVRALPEIIAHFKKNGYEFAPLTADVQPVMFRIADEVKGRSPGLDKHLAILDMIDAMKMNGLEDSGSTHLAPVDEVEPNHSVSRIINHRIERVGGTENETLQENEREEEQRGDEDRSLHTGPLIPLRAVMEAKGAKVQWWGEQQKAIVYDRHFMIEYGLKEQQVRMYSPGSMVHMSVVPELQIVDGTLFVPRSALLTL